MDNKRKGSNPQQSPSGSGRVAWDEPRPRDTFNFADDEEDGPLPAPPEFDGERGSVPELIDGEEVVDEPIDDADLLDSALVNEVRPVHALPPPIPAPLPGAARPGFNNFNNFIDDGEIALPPRMSHLVKSFPFRQVQAEDDPSAEELLDDDAEELDPDDLESVTDGPVESNDHRDNYDTRDPAEQSAATFQRRDVREPGVVQDDDDADNRPSEPATTGARWSFADLDRPAAASSSTSATRLTAAGRAHMFADEAERSAETIADGTLAHEDDTGVFMDTRDNTPTGLFARDQLRAAANPAFAALPTDEELELPITDDVPTDDESSMVLSAQRLRDAASSRSGQIPVDDEETSGWVHARGPQPSAAIPVADIDDDDDATWDVALRPPVPAAQSQPRIPVVPVVSSLSSSANLKLPSVPSQPIAQPKITPIRGDEDTVEHDGESSIGGWIATRPGASMASGVIAVDDFEDDVWPQPVAPSPSAPTPSVAASADDEDDDDQDSDDEWSSQIGPAISLAPAPTDLGESFPLDLWSDPDELVGRDLGGCRLERPLSRGMATRVYLGQEIETGRRVAVRVLSPTYSPAEPRARQFLYEAQQLIKLRSEHIVEVLRAGTTSDHLTYYVMEYLAGETLASALRSEGPMPWADVAAFANQICDALILAAERGIVHNDLTAATCVRIPGEPARSEGERGRDVIKLLGVGVTPLTSVFRNTDGAWTVSQGTPVGAAEFMAPEIAGGGRPDARTAVYAVGVLMYELTTGRPPFRGDSFIAVLKKQMYEEAMSPRLVVPEQEIPDVFEIVVERALAKAPGDRYSDLRALDEALLAARAREGELRRVTQILALDPAFWDEDGSRRVKQGSSPLRAAGEPTPLATFAADLKQRQPELAAQVFKSDRPSREPSMALHLTQLAAPIVAPALPPAHAVEAAPNGQVIVVSRPPTTNTLFRNVSLAIVIASVVVIAALWLSDRGRANRKATEVAAENRRPAGKSKTRASRDTRPRAETPDRGPPTTVLAPPSEPETPTKVAPPPEPEPAPAPEPEPAVKEAPPPEPDPPEVKEAPTPAVVPTPAKPPPDKPTQTKPPPVKKPAKEVDPLDDRPESITKGRLEAKLTSMEPRVTSRCRTKAGVPDPHGLSVTLKVTVDVKGEVRAKSGGAYAGTPLGQCIEEVLEAIRFNETRSGGGITHTFKF